MHAEYARQRQHLEHSVAALRKKLSKDTEIHRMDNIRVMQVCTGVHVYTHAYVQVVDLASLHMHACIRALDVRTSFSRALQLICSYVHNIMEMRVPQNCYNISKQATPLLIHMCTDSNARGVCPLSEHLCAVTYCCDFVVCCLWFRKTSHC